MTASTQVGTQAANGTAPTSARRRSADGGTRVRAGNASAPYLFLAPFMIIFGVFVLVPAVYGIWMSLHNWDFFLPERPWVGLGNYLELFDPTSLTAVQFWESMRATGLFVLFSVPFLVVIPLGLALMLNRVFPGRTFFRAVYFAPYVLGVAVIGVLWQNLLNANVGLINYYLGRLGVTEIIPWLTATPWVWVTLVGVTVWWTLGFNAVVYLAGLQGIDTTLYEAARVDGASRWHEFWHVTLPGLRPVLLFVVTITILASANMFGQSYLLTGGAPSNETRTAIMYIAQTGFEQFRMGRAAAMSYILCLLLIGISALNFLLFRRQEKN
ncbi:binding-protein-dependent transport systems inner membrane component [Beutenbergia cavernae DSM 12333]|uniref:Binding-protein-dependent transport systems inner membrane component n=1 Tax=Beutenbergia cavernae (strain ATCC BAA-8 / DSM 12333 / CCUG 43141 / JCM 11478 / NBRC 16432 / NCIMB 13614 / HKI 0122) TaxID=471853 RepID=C5BY15_BEUC1|nr:sugar ABC transporter permease [Beutenbergia cavernae]ACQ78909.1 binding-protein-dependent transport systems inner membrane component [Beutenbergia cavernae DSM 12333]